MRRWFTAGLAVLAAGLFVPLRGIDKANIVNSQHDFRVSSSATLKAATEVNAGEQLCVFCHTPHNANPGPELWNQNMGNTQFATYASTTLQSTVPAVTPQDASKLCLSCHDGTIALGSTVRNGQIPFVQGAGYALPASSVPNIAGYGGYGFSDDHPFAFSPNYSNAEIKAPQTGDPVKMFAGKIQCVTCHDAHDEQQDSTTGMFLVKNNKASALCATCHQSNGWAGSAHQQPPDALQDARYTSAQGAHTGYTGVANNGCESCHKPHAPQVGQRLMKFPEENACLPCHDGSVTALNLKNEFGKQYKHPVMVTPSVHDESEQPNSSQFPLPETAAGTPRHAECQDCHNGHAAQTTPSGYAPKPPLVTPPLIGVRGQSVANTYLPQSTNEYEICFKCHGDSANKPPGMDMGSTGTGFGRNPRRQFDVNNPNAYNTRLEFTNSVSAHPVARPGVVPAGQVPSLRQYIVSGNRSEILNRPLSPNSQIYCSDCHNNDTGRQTIDAGTGPSGPHGSNWPHLLERNLAMEPPPASPGGASNGLGSYSSNNFKLCDKCHDLDVVLSPQSAFPLHSLHVQTYNASCDTCHSPHSSAAQHLVNFDLTIVGGASPAWTQTAPGQGSCTLVCHGSSHPGYSYPIVPGAI